MRIEEIISFNLMEVIQKGFKLDIISFDLMEVIQKGFKSPRVWTSFPLDPASPFL
jgi:hypothetical protein